MSDFDDLVEQHTVALIEVNRSVMAELATKQPVPVVLATMFNTAIDMLSIVMATARHTPDPYPEPAFLDDVVHAIRQRAPEMEAGALAGLAIMKAKEAA